ncbi:recombinase family protein [Pseudactinotalea sp. Z1739]|uniref:recombinase family protein n=1 Tax=Pseudactinotalea sp. Z1739 TaxID=3413028 RepID=UPI003C79F293
MFRQMLARIQARRDVDVVLVYMFERAGRNQWEDAIVGMVFQSLGVQLISVTEPMDDTPAGKAMRGMISVFNEMMSTSRGADIKRKMEAAAKRGKTLGRARLGYLNVRDVSEGRDIRTIEVDPERAPFVKLAFELYATGEYTLNDIVDELTDRGLTTRPTAKHPAGPVSVNKVHQMLRDPYYTGVVIYEGEQIPGKHEPLIDQELFDKVQEVNRARGKSGERRREHHHYLKGTVFCGQCKQQRDVDRRLLIQRSVGPELHICLSVPVFR